MAAISPDGHQGDVPLPRSAQSADGLRQRKMASAPASESEHADASASSVGDTSDRKVKDDVTWGKTPSGVVFRVPQTHSFFTTMLTTLHRSSLTRLTFLSLVAQPALFYLLRNHSIIRSAIFLLYFAFWRGAYDFGFAWLLRKQSEKRWIVRQLKSRGWLDINSESGGQEGREWAKWWKRELEMKMGEGYKWEGVPPEFNAWLMFRQLVDVVLLNDFVSYSCFAWSNLHFPPNHSTTMHIFRWVFGWALIFFNLWVKMDAHRVVKDYAWYWGDAFWLMVMQHDLVFDGVYEIAPHPMYSVGYAGYYGLSMVVGSYSVLFVSLAAHAAQFAFLLWFENPHIDRTYGGSKKPLASRIPLSWAQGSPAPSESQLEESAPLGESSFSLTPEDAIDAATPAATEGETETEPELPELPANETSEPSIRKPRSDSSYSGTSISIAPTEALSKLGAGYKRPSTRGRARAVSMHDLTHRFFRKPVVVLWRLDVFRANDFALVVLILYAMVTLVPALPSQLALTAHFLHALGWRLFHSYGLGLLLRAQSKSKWLVRHYLKHYHYPGAEGGDAVDGTERETVVKRATEEAFGNWQVGYNISLVMTYVSFAGLAWKTYHLPMDWTVSGTILRHVLGSLLIALHIWAAVSSYEVLGDFGWLYSDFFLTEQIPSQLAYTGIYRFLNNPERSMGGAAFFGLWLISNSKLVLALAVISHLSHWWFLSTVERPHMKRLYGDRLRKDGGLTKTLKSVADKTLSTKAGKHGQDIKRVVQEVRGSIEKVEEKVTEAVEEFLDHARPMFSDMVNDTRILLQQSRERMIITRVASDISSYDASRYSMTLPTGSSVDVPRFHVGQPIGVSWTAPANHSRKDWIGIYRLGSCKSQLVTRISSVGKWMPIYEDEYDGDRPIKNPVNGDESPTRPDAGEVVFRGDQLPWAPGQYELRYHHDGKHNVMSRVAPIEIYVNKPTRPSSYREVRSTLLNIVNLSLDSDPTLVPRSLKSANISTVTSSASLAEAGDSSTPNLLSSPKSASSETLSPKKTQAQLPSSPSSNVSLGDLVHSDADADAADEEDDDDIVDGHDPDDFSIMDENQARRITSLCEMAFGVQISVDVVVADANVGVLARRVVGARSLVAASVAKGSG